MHQDEGFTETVYQLEKRNEAQQNMDHTWQQEPSCLEKLTTFLYKD